MLKTLEDRAQALEGKSLRECTQKTLKQILHENNTTRMWLQEDEELNGWGTEPEQVEELLIGETEFEVSFPLLPAHISITDSHENSLPSGAEVSRLWSRAK
jgi:hypothetical protein